MRSAKYLFSDQRTMNNAMHNYQIIVNCYTIFFITFVTIFLDIH